MYRQSLRYRHELAPTDKALILFVVVTFAGATVHELGHASVCAYYGHQWKIDLFGHLTPQSFCSSATDHLTLRRAAGGLPAAAILAIPLVIFRKNKYVLSAFIPNVILNAVAGILEPFANEVYQTQALTVFMTIFWLAIGIFLVCKYHR